MEETWVDVDLDEIISAPPPAAPDLERPTLQEQSRQAPEHEPSRSGNIVGLSMSSWDDMDGSIDTILYSRGGLHAFLRTARAKFFFYNAVVTSMIVVFLGVTRPMESIGWPHLGHELGPPHIIFIKIHAWNLVWIPAILFLVQVERVGEAINTLSHALTVIAAFLFAGLVFSAIARTRCLLLYHCVFFIWMIYLRILLASNGLFMLRFLQSLPVVMFITGMGCFVAGDNLWGIILGGGCAPYVCICAYVQWRRRMAMQGATALVQADAERYHGIWTQLVSAEKPAIDTLEREARTIGKGLGARTELRQQVADLTELYSQAYRLDDIFQAHVQQWAGAMGARSLRAPVKRQNRTLQKVMRHYSGDPSRVCDLVRATLVFESFEGLCDGLKTIASDETVCIDRIKNRFDSSYPAEQSAGYRDVSLVVRIRTIESRAAGTDMHLCEVQLQVAPLLAVKSDEGHKRYVQWRNICCA